MDRLPHLRLGLHNSGNAIQLNKRLHKVLATFSSFKTQWAIFMTN